MIVRRRGKTSSPDLRRLEQLYEISKLFTNFENVEQTFDAALGVAATTLPILTAILIESIDDHPAMTIWHSEGVSSERVQAARVHVESAYGYLVGTRSNVAHDSKEQAILTTLPRQAADVADPEKRFIVIPLVVPRGAPFGALQVEGARPLDKSDLVFVNAVANQLAVALDRDRAWRRDIARREYAEQGRADAEATSEVAEHRRVAAETLKEQCEALAAENARLYGQAQQAVRVREQMLAIVSHDLKNPLTTILATAQTLAKRSPAEEQRKGLPAAVGRIRRAAERMERLIGDLLDFASIEAGRLAITRRPQDPASMVREVLTNFDTMAQEKRLRLQADVASRLPEVSCDHDRILQVFSNLIDNAIKVTAEGGRITLRAEGRAREVVFAVADTGPGISERDAAHLFERYWRSGESQYRGTGLGLAIAKGIVSAHGGRIWVETALGQGATFWFTIPVADPDQPRSAETPVGKRST